MYKFKVGDRIDVVSYDLGHGTIIRVEDPFGVDDHPTYYVRLDKSTDMVNHMWCDENDIEIIKQKKRTMTIDINGNLI